MDGRETSIRRVAGRSSPIQERHGNYRKKSHGSDKERRKISVADEKQPAEGNRCLLRRGKITASSNRDV
jgi:hypothetical protein